MGNEARCKNIEAYGGFRGWNMVNKGGFTWRFVVEVDAV